MAGTNLVAGILSKISKDPYKIIGPFIKGCSAETIRKSQIAMLKDGVFESRRKRRGDDAVLGIKLWNKKFPNPIGVAAGYDVNVQAIDALMEIGYGFGEVGTVTYEKDIIPRQIIKLKADEAFIDQSIGYNNLGSGELVQKLVERRGHKGIVGVSIGENTNYAEKEEDVRNRVDPIEQYKNLVRAVAPYADYVTVNISSPNMVGIAEYETEIGFDKLVRNLKDAIQKAAPINTPQLLFKIRTDISDITKEVIAKTAIKENIDGIIIGGTSKRRPEDLKTLSAFKETGGLSGKPIFEASTFLLKEMYYYTQGQIPLIGVGGVFTGKDAYIKIRSGASLVQLHSAIMYRGPKVVEEIKTDLVKRLKADGFKSVAQAVGVDLR